MRSALPVQVTVGILIEISPDSTRTRNKKNQPPPQKKKNTKQKKQNKTATVLVSELLEPCSFFRQNSRAESVIKVVNSVYGYYRVGFGLNVYIKKIMLFYKLSRS